uniref:Uncharacterized protein n=1 Tax=Biomphalaria glabrata TaxID=6526 RepID=A0A2C9KF01_BIOGL
MSFRKVDTLDDQHLDKSEKSISQIGLMSRVKEASLVLFLLGILVMGLAYVASAIISGDESTKQTLSVCTPVGVARMFTVMGQLIVKPQFLRGIEDELSRLRLQEEHLLRKITYRNGPCQISNGHGHSSIESLMETLEDTRKAISKLVSRQHISFWRRNLCYPLVMLLLLAITVFSILIVLQNTFLLLVGTKALPRGASTKGQSSDSAPL